MGEFVWKDKQDGVDDVLAEDINKLAHGMVALFQDKHNHANKNVLEKVTEDHLSKAENSEQKGNKNVPNGYAGLDEDGLIHEEQVPKSIARDVAVEKLANKGQPDGYTPLNEEAVVPDEHLPITRERTLLSNALKGTASGAVVALNDVSPVEHEVECVVRSKNAIIYPFISSDGTYAGDESVEDSGVEITTENGEITLNGTANTNFTFWLCNNVSLLPDTQYTLHGLTGVKTGNQIQLFVAELAGGSLGTYYASIWTDVSKPFTTSKDASKKYAIVLYIKSGVKFENITIQPMLEIGTEATEWAPYVAPDTVSLNKHGKNIAEYSEVTKSSTYAWANASFLKTLPLGKYVLSCNFAQKGYVSRVLISVKENGSTTTLNSASSTEESGKLSFSFEITDTSKIWLFTFFANGTADTLETEAICEFSNIQLEVDSGTGEPTAFEEHVTAVKYAPDADGTVEGMTSLAPNMTLMTDTEGVVIDVTYNRDINKALDEVGTEVASDDWKQAPVLTIEITEQCTAIDVTEIDGKPFEFTELAGYVELVTTTSHEGRMAILLNTTGSGASYNGLVCLNAPGSTAASAVTKGMFEVKKEFGMWHTSNVSYYTDTWLALNGTKYEHWDSKDVFKSVDAITSFRLVPYSGNFNAGTVIKIFGKRV